MEAIKGIETYLTVGTVLTLQLTPITESSTRARSLLRGWVKDEYLIVDWPLIHQDLSRARPGQRCVVRFISQGNAVGFTSGIANMERHVKHPNLCIQWPDQVTSVGLRRSERASVIVPCAWRTEDNQETIGEVHDVSEGGCGLLGAAPIKIGSRVSLGFQLPDGYTVENLTTIVRSCTPHENGFKMGCQFEATDSDTRDAITLFVASLVDSRRKNVSNQKRIVLFESDFEIQQRARKTLREVGFNVVAASDLVQLIHRLHVSPPTVVLYGLDSTNIPFATVKALLAESENARAAEFLPYGETSPDLKLLGADALSLNTRLAALTREAAAGVEEFKKAQS